MTFPSALHLPNPCPRCSSEDWSWVALYRDSTALPECQGADLAHHRFADVEIDRCIGIILIPNRQHLPIHQLRLLSGGRPIFFRRRVLPVGDVDPQRLQGATCLGWQMTVDKKVNVASYTFYFEDGRTIVSDNPNPY